MEKKAEIEAAYDTYGNIRDAAKSLGISKSEFHRRLHEVKNQSYILPEIPEDDLPIEEIVNHLHQRFQKRKDTKRTPRGALRASFGYTKHTPKPHPDPEPYRAQWGGGGGGGGRGGGGGGG